jgi:T-complex protein 1 subunit theta
MNKMVINHLERLFVTSDASTIVTELEVNHPAAKLLVHAAKAQEAEIGDGTNLVSHRPPLHTACKAAVA